MAIFPMSAFPDPSVCDIACPPGAGDSENSNSCGPSLSDTCMPTGYTEVELTVINGDASNGTIGWIATYGATTKSDTTPLPIDGGSTFWGGSGTSGLPTLQQTIAIPVELQGVLGSYYRVEWDQASNNAQYDPATIRITQRDSGSGGISSEYPYGACAVDGTWHHRVQKYPLATNCVELELDLRFEDIDTSGSVNTEGMIKNVRVFVESASPGPDTTGLTLSTPSQPDGDGVLDGFTIVDPGWTDVWYAAPGNNGNYFYGGSGIASTSAYFDTDIGITPIDQVDDCGCVFRLTWSNFRYLEQYDTTNWTIEFKDSVGSIIHTEQTLPCCSNLNQELSILLPAGTRTMRIHMNAERTYPSGSNLNGYIRYLYCYIIRRNT